MPCEYYTAAERAEMASAALKAQAEKIDALTRMLCDMMRQYEVSDIYPNEEVLAWWEHHKAHDEKMLAEKRAKEAEERRKKREAKKAKEDEERAIYERLTKKYGPREK